METRAIFNYSLNLKLKTTSPFFGPGTVELLQHILTTNSLNTAAKRMNMSYNKAWRMIKKAEEVTGCQLVLKSVGGNNGGGSIVTKAGIQLMDKFILFQKKSYAAADTYFNEIFLEE